MKKLTKVRNETFPTKYEISAFEVLNDFRFPDVFRYFLMTQNPHVVEEQLLQIQNDELLVFGFIPFSTKEDSSFQRVFRKTHPYLKGQYIPFANCAFGQLIVISTNQKDFGSIFLWQNESSIDQMTFVAEDITAFVNALK